MKKYKIKQPLPQFGENVARVIEVPYEVVKQIRADVIDEFVRKLYEGCNEMIETCGSNTAPISWAEAYADFKADIDVIAEQLKVKEQEND